jgi:SNF2 family DNA or RNA helicase
MHERETGTIQPLGGLQADQMGFGKTLMTIATILANPPRPEDSKCTLIVCTPALLTQWMDELASHVESGFLPQVVRYQASTGKITFGKKCEYTLSNANVVLTTYQEVLRSYPKYNPPKNLVTDEEKKAWWKTVHEGKRDLLHQIHFFRVVLDEAQAIKNCKSQTSIACRALMAKHRWALSGTPIQNNVEELFPYFKFLRVKHTGNFQVFKENFCSSNNKDSTTRLHSFLKQFMIRRTHKDKLFGAPIVPMPPTTQVTHVIEFNVVERAIYEAVKLNYIEKINTTSRAGTLEKNYQNVLVCDLATNTRASTESC